MERQQEILFRIVSEAKGTFQNNQYSMTSPPPLPVGQMDPLLKLTVEQMLGNHNPSAFAPSRLFPVNNQRSGLLVTPVANQAQNVPRASETNGQADSTLSLAQILSEIYSCNIGKH